MRQTKLRHSVLFSSEFYFLLVVLVSFIYSIAVILYKPDANYVHQFKDFDEQVEATLICDSNTIVPHLTNGSGNLESVHLVEKSKQVMYHNPSPICPIDEDRLKYFDNYEYNSRLTYDHVQIGGYFKPMGCEARQRVAIVIPYKNRAEQLERFSLYIHQFLPDQLIEYTVYVIEQADDLPFNRAKLFNVGFAEINKMNPNVCCFIFHDVDLLPLDQKNLYMCSTKLRHLSDGVSTMRYNLLYPGMLGGVVAMTKSQFESLDGFSNLFFGWGGEDDDIFRRVKASGLTIERTPKKHGLYVMLKHPKMEPNPLRFELEQKSLENAKTPETATTSRSTTYTVERITKEQLYTFISVRL